MLLRPFLRLERPIEFLAPECKKVGCGIKAPLDLHLQARPFLQPIDEQRELFKIRRLQFRAAWREILETDLLPFSPKNRTHNRKRRRSNLRDDVDNRSRDHFAKTKFGIVQLSL